MRLFAPLCTIAVALSLAGSAGAASRLPESGYLVFKDMRSYAVKEVRDKTTGRVVASEASFGDKTAPGTACGDSHHKFAGAHWQAFESYLVNASSTPSHIDSAAALSDIRAAHRAWESPFTTDCTGAPTGSEYRSFYGGTTRRSASLAASLVSDGDNVAAFQSLAGSICDGAIACVVVDYKGSKVIEADLAFERDLTRYGFQDFWTTDDTTKLDNVGGRVSVSDTATHEWGHFAGLDHVENSPALTMFPSIHDGAQTLGLGDMKGVLARY